MKIAQPTRNIFSLNIVMRFIVDHNVTINLTCIWVDSIDKMVKMARIRNQVEEDVKNGKKTINLNLEQKKLP